MTQIREIKFLTCPYPTCIVVVLDCKETSLQFTGTFIYSSNLQQVLHFASSEVIRHFSVLWIHLTIHFAVGVLIRNFKIKKKKKISSKLLHFVYICAKWNSFHANHANRHCHHSTDKPLDSSFIDKTQIVGHKRIVTNSYLNWKQS